MLDFVKFIRFLVMFRCGVFFLRIEIGCNIEENWYRKEYVICVI